MTSEGPLRERNSRAAERLARHRHANNHQNNTVATCAPPASLQLARSESNGVIQRLTNNLEHYSNVFQDMALPVLLSARARSASGNRSHRRRASSERRGRNGSPFPSDRNSDEDDFVYVESIELSQLDAFVPKESNSHGHRFNVVHLKAPTWCDKCGDFIWGVYKQCLVCQNCQFTCHHKCRPLVTLDCASSSSSSCVEAGGGDRARNLSETSLTEHSGADETDSGYHTGRSTLRCSGRYDPSPLAVTPSNTLPASANQQAAISREELRRKIESFNGNQHGLIMSMQGAGLTFQGFIRVHMNLIRPINMSVSARPPSIYDVLTHGEEEEVPPPEVEEITSFYLPKDTTKVIHIDSHTTAQEVIKALLAKFKITDNPRKFALYEKPLGDGAGTMRRLMDDETPLTLCLSWTAQGIAGLDVHKFILQENDTGEIMWEAFSLPELENFLRILNKEEDEYLDQVKAKYRLLRIQIGKRLADLKPSSNPHEEDKRQPVFV